MGSRAFIVSGDCYVEDANWLATGFEIWQSFLTDRPYFLPLPTADMQGILPCEVMYVDATGMSRALLRQLKCRAGEGAEMESLLHPECIGIWKEHSLRHNMPSWTASGVRRWAAAWVECGSKGATLKGELGA